MSWQTNANLAWLRGLRGVEEGRPLARHTSFNIGGPAQFFLQTPEPAQLVEACQLRGVPVLLLGAGTNLLVADAGVKGLVVRCVNREWRVEGTRVHAQAGLKMMRLARICADHDLTGFEWAIGVPGTVGGAVYQNAGCWGVELVEVLVEAEGVLPGGGRQTWSPDQLRLGYRTSALRDGALEGALVSAATLQLSPGDGAAGRRQMARWTAERNRTQPIRSKNCGSVFKNPPGDSAGRLIEAAGLKGAGEGAAQVSEQHANFIVNNGGATAVEVSRLIDRVRCAVHQRSGVMLETEVELVGRWQPE
ncbi:MAG: UDP-N-acetylenolpyruvoylglucosamine reductase [Candidatus Nephthysia bennettiae]|uniref:UDP-N-acetylenolpyruvoylglucosamine reductase n=1 Tax=Candidatus Nephthysia bennettiae TaxID=3127016 RepID=A0A934KAL7_9BACT|nr:UDP-N-acetylmuramate dehydrogenase [Candidatus Dormibacteraeota bacterium]MBJ7611357.1 UDP-N-acetylmuramate dehydrogenase [Candidatus Dormibacteraeota bacterium]PZR89214.1 MAG: UDP-N-acetylenolpyruvoylglucosamine reductase [Candidatus Dormibacteraeota bacterium]